MAITLPYPNLTFVPLDVLTADSLNNMHANTKALANAFPVSSANIANGAVTAAKLASGAVNGDKINWLDTLQFDSISKTSSTPLVGTDWSTVFSISVAGMPVGAKFLASATLAFGGGGSDIGMSARLLYNSGNSSPTVTQTASWGKSLSVQYDFTKVSGYSSVAVQVKKDNTESASLDSAYGYAFRVG